MNGTRQPRYLGCYAGLAKLAVGLRLGLALGVSAATATAGYRIEKIAYPAELRGGISGVAFTPAGTLVVATRYGEIWMRPADGGWRRFARGLNEPMGLVAESERVVYVAHRPELLRAADTDGDGRADTFDALGGQWGLSQNYHSFFFGLTRDRAGNFYGAVSLESTGANAEDRNAVLPAGPRRGPRDATNVLDPTFHRSESPWGGWAVRITPRGEFEPLASGFRQPAGMGLSPAGELFLTDNQGDYKPSCGLLHVERGDFHGHMASLKWERGFDPASLTTEQAWRRYKGPAVVFPHGPMGVSAGEPAWDVSGGKFGPFAGQAFVGDFTALVIRASLERVAGGWQGACFPFLGRNNSPNLVTGEKIAAGATHAAFAPDGSLYLGATAGWGGGSDGLQRVAWDGQAPPEVLDLRITDRGFRLTFTRPMQAATLANPANYSFTRFRFYYHWKYGSPWVDESRPAVTSVLPAADGLSAELTLDELKPGFVYELSVPSLRTANGEPLANPLAYYTANRLPNGEIAVGGTTRLPAPGETSQGAAKAAQTAATAPAGLVDAGAKVYRFYCVACHQADGRGLQSDPSRGLPGDATRAPAGVAAAVAVFAPANFVDDKSRLAKSDAELLQSIADGMEAKGMPAFGASLTPVQRRAVLAYIRATFGDKGNP